MEVHGDYTAEDVGVKVDRPADETMVEFPLLSLSLSA
jgi:small subunit ribosomal protein S3Ae